jgi:cellulose synthase/poly-beta-1,6-N-acetylglucosamine synthase-like glycosyltransferase
MNSLLFAIAETDRHMRQRVVRAGRDAYGVSNLSGYCMLANREKYLNIIDTEAIQDDVIATINLLQKKYTVKTYHKSVCSEIERSSFKSYLMQKTRWTAGNIVLIKSYNKLFRKTTFAKAFAFSSSFLLWYWSLWVDFFAFFVALFHPTIFVLLLSEGIIKYIGLYFACKPESRNLAILTYIVFWPIFSTMCLIMSPYYLSGRIIEQNTRR